MKRLLVTMLGAAFAASALRAGELPGLKDAYADDFLCCVALNNAQTPSARPGEDALITRNFNAVVAENCMKSGSLQPREGVFDFAAADRLVAFARARGMKVVGHCLVWHSQLPDWFLKGADGKEVTKDVLLKRMRDHIGTVMRHFKGQVIGWDVLNEALDGNGDLRADDPFMRIIGPEYVAAAFRFAHEADPDCPLYYNDYGLADPKKRAGVLRLVAGLRAQGLRIDAVGMQTHVDMTYPDIRDYETSVKAFAAAGVDVMVTEMDISVLPWIDGEHTADISTHAGYQAKYDFYRNGLTPAATTALGDRYAAFFAVFRRNRVRPGMKGITRVTLWGLEDGQSWLNNFPMHGRVNHPLLFDRNLKPKSCLDRIIKEAHND